MEIEYQVHAFSYQVYLAKINPIYFCIYLINLLSRVENGILHEFVY